MTVFHTAAEAVMNTENQTNRYENSPVREDEQSVSLVNNNLARNTNQNE